MINIDIIFFLIFAKRIKLYIINYFLLSFMIINKITTNM